MPINLRVESVESLAGLISTIGPYARKHPERAVPLATAIVKAFAVHTGEPAAGEPERAEHVYQGGERADVRPIRTEHHSGDGCGCDSDHGARHCPACGHAIDGHYPCGRL